MSSQCPELENIRKVIDLYIDGVCNGNVESLRRAFHPQSSMFKCCNWDARLNNIS
ncbi:MAG: nuclear transport factor 2 family protein [Acidobacteriota bacterium]|nr:MAG: nuclear transport factor 2 family protein [Acidobacteriota bacterium]